MSILDTDELLVVVAHYDDEVLFCGGTLFRLKELKKKLLIAVVTHVNDTNQGSDNEELRQKIRLDSFGRVLQELNATGYHLNLPNYRGFSHTFSRVFSLAIKSISDLCELTTPGAVLTHGYHGEYGNWMHRLVHYAVREVWRGALWSFDLSGICSVDINWEEKKKLLKIYEDSVVLGHRWRPWEQSAFIPYCTSFEGFARELC